MHSATFAVAALAAAAAVVAAVSFIPSLHLSAVLTACLHAETFVMLLLLQTRTERQIIFLFLGQILPPFL